MPGKHGVRIDGTGMYADRAEGQFLGNDKKFIKNENK